jgi:protein-tyrosine phosphatase
LLNLRDVGPLPLSDGRAVAAGRLYRSDAPFPDDVDPGLRPWPPRTVIDLRSAGEAAATAHPLDSSGTTVVGIPLFRELDPRRMAAVSRGPERSLEEIYRGLLRASAASLARVVETVAFSQGPVLLHCAAGKDRTGVAIAVTLAAVGVPDEAIVADYMLTEKTLGDLPGRLALGWSESQRGLMDRLTNDRPDLLGVTPAAIQGVLAQLADSNGGAAGWLRENGLATRGLAALTHRLTGP